jgi:carbon starvation protein
MLLEAMVAVISLGCVMILATGSPLLENPKPNFIYAQGLATFLATFGIPATLAVSFGLMAFTTFVYDTLDVCTRLGRYIIEELLNRHDKAARALATGLTAGVPLVFLMRTSVDAAGKEIPVWRTFWALFGASNQLLAALTLLGVTVWLWRTRREKWVWLVTGIPTVWMYAMSVWALGSMVAGKFFAEGRFALTTDPVGWVGLVLVGLALLMLVEALKAFRVMPPSLPRDPQPAPATA